MHTIYQLPEQLPKYSLVFIVECTVVEVATTCGVTTVEPLSTDTPKIWTSTLLRTVREVPNKMPFTYVYLTPLKADTSLFHYSRHAILSQSLFNTVVFGYIADSTSLHMLYKMSNGLSLYLVWAQVARILWHVISFGLAPVPGLPMGGTRCVPCACTTLVDGSVPCAPWACNCTMRVRHVYNDCEETYV